MVDLCGECHFLCGLSTCRLSEECSADMNTACVSCAILCVLFQTYTNIIHCVCSLPKLSLTYTTLPDSQLTQNNKARAYSTGFDCDLTQEFLLKVFTMKHFCYNENLPQKSYLQYQVAVMLGMNRYGSFPLLSAIYMYIYIYIYIYMCVCVCVCVCVCLLYTR